MRFVPGGTTRNRLLCLGVAIALTASFAPGAEGAGRTVPVSSSNVRAFSNRFADVFALLQKPLVARLLRTGSTSGRDRLVAFTLNAAGGTARVEGFGLVLPKPSKFELSIDLHGVHDTPKTGKPLTLAGLLQFDLVPYAAGKAVGLFAGRLRLSGAYRGAVDVTGEVDGARVAALEVISGGTTLHPTSRRPRPFVSYVSTIAGNGDEGFVDGKGRAARFNDPSGVAVDEDGTIYVADERNNAVREVAPNGTVTTLADENDGIEDPADLGIDDTGDVVVTQGTYADLPLVRIDPDNGVVTPIVFNQDQQGTGYCGLNLPPCEGRSPLGTMTWPEGIDVQGSVSYVAEYAPEWIRIVLPDGTIATVFKDPAGGCSGMSDVAKGTRGELYYVAHWANCDGVFVVRPDGTAEVLAGNDQGDFGSKDGIGPAAKFFHPAGIVFDGSRYLYVADWNDLIRRIDVETGEVRRVAGCIPHRPGFNCDSSQHLRDGDGEYAQFNVPERLTLDQWGDLYVADGRNNAIRLVRIVRVPEREPSVLGFQPFIVTQGQRTDVEVTGDHLGLAESASLGPGVTVTLTHAGSKRLLLDVEVAPDAEPGGRTLQITTPYGTVASPPSLSFVIAEKGEGAVVETIAGTGSWLPGVTDGPADQAQFAFPGGSVLIDEDRLLVVDTLEQRVRLVATKKGAADELLELTLHSLGGAGVAIGAILAGLGLLGEILSDLGLEDAMQQDNPEDAIKDVIARSIDQMCQQANSDCDWIVLPWAGLPVSAGDQNGFRLNSTFLFPIDVAKASNSKFFIADAGNQRIRVVGIDPTDDQPKDAPYQVFSTVTADSRPLSVTDTTGDAAQVGIPKRVLKLEMSHSGTYSDVVGDPTGIGCGATDQSVRIGVPMGMDRAGGVTYVADPFCQTVWMIEDGQLKDIRGTLHIPGPNLGRCSDGPAAIAGFGAPVDVAAGPNGALWIVDALCNSVRVIYDAGEPIEAVIGTFRDYLGLVEDHLPAAEFNRLEQGLETLDEDFVSSIRYWVTTVAGGGRPGFQDGPADQARFSIPLGIDVTTRDGKLAVFISDAGNRRIRLLTIG